MAVSPLYPLSKPGFAGLSKTANKKSGRKYFNLSYERSGMKKPGSIERPAGSV